MPKQNINYALAYLNRMVVWSVEEAKNDMIVKLNNYPSMINYADLAVKTSKLGTVSVACLRSVFWNILSLLLLRI